MKHLQFAAVVILSVLLASCGDNKKSVELKTLNDSASYAIGYNFGKSLVGDGVKLNADVVAIGISDADSSAKPLLNDEQVRAVIGEFQQDVMKRQQERMKVQGEKNKSEGQAFLEANKSKPGVTVTASGVQYIVLKKGEGPTAKTSQMVTVHYKGTLIDGKEFDSSIKRGQPATFPVGGLFKGMNEILQMMPVGSKWQVFFPSELAYGETGAPPMIAPNAVLIFELEVLGIK